MPTEHKSTEELIDLMAKCPRPGATYRHYRGDLYVVIARGIDEATLQPVVLYQPFRSILTWARPLASWNETVEHEGQQVPRFSPAN